jgi:aromatic-L-amino-acid decarboxylase
MTDLDPSDWEEFRKASHLALDVMIDDLQSIRERPVWRKAPKNVLKRFQMPLPRRGRQFQEVLKDFNQNIRRYATGNRHPLFMGWAHGAGTPVGMVAEMLAAGLNANCGGRHHIGIEVERQITRWVAEALGLPKNSSGLFVTGSSIANFIGLLVARTSKLEQRRSAQSLVAYASAEAHECLRQAMEMSGLGSSNFRQIATDSSKALQPDLLAAAIDADIDAGYTPFLVVGTPGTVNSGAIDPLEEIAIIAKKKGLWFHIDGAIGAAAMLSENLKPLMKGFKSADSVALDFHKWMHVPYDAGFLIVRDPKIHLKTFESDAAYLSRAKTGIAAGKIWPCDLGPDLSRGFRALKTWFTFETLGADKIGQCIDQNCSLARYLAERVVSDGLFQLCAPVSLNIVCFSAKGRQAKKLNRQIVEDLQTSGQAVASMTILDGRPVIRTAIFNHRTTKGDIDTFVRALNDRLVRITGKLRRSQSLHREI